jgi:hypothetical protein
LDILNDGDLVPDGISFTTSRIVQGMDVWGLTVNELKGNIIGFTMFSYSIVGHS